MAQDNTGIRRADRLP